MRVQSLDAVRVAWTIHDSIHWSVDIFVAVSHVPCCRPFVVCEYVVRRRPFVVVVDALFRFRYVYGPCFWSAQAIIIMRTPLWLRFVPISRSANRCCCVFVFFLSVSERY